jgi:hypothetical protein
MTLRPEQAVNQVSACISPVRVLAQVDFVGTVMKLALLPQDASQTPKPPERLGSLKFVGMFLEGDTEILGSDANLPGPRIDNSEVPLHGHVLGAGQTSRTEKIHPRDVHVTQFAARDCE